MARDGIEGRPEKVEGHDTPIRRSNYFQAHWRGEQSLAWSFWINGVVLTVLGQFGITAIIESVYDSGIGLQAATVTTLLLILLAVICTVWQFVGIWRSASRTSVTTQRSFWPGVAKFMVVLVVFTATMQTVTATTDLVAILRELRDPTLVDYEVERVDDTYLTLTGAINDESAAEVIDGLSDPAIAAILLDSHGGLTEPAIRLARYIREHGVMVIAKNQCVSACVIVLAGSPHVSIYPRTEVTFHRTEPVAEFINPDFRAESQQYLAESDEIYREFGIADWAIDTAARHEFWTPTVDQLVQMKLVGFIFDAEQRRFIPAEEYCAADPAHCN